jgi:hypothetical protein
VLALAFAAASLVAAGAHAAGASGGPGSSAIAQYVEMVPTGTGDQPPGVGSQQETKLPPKLKHRIQTQGGSDAPALVAVASSPTYGAPPPTEPAPTTAVQPTSRVNASKPSKPSEATKSTKATKPPPPAAQRVVRSLGEPVPAPSVGRTLESVVPGTTGAVLATWLGLLLVAAAAGAFVLQRRRSA